MQGLCKSSKSTNSQVFLVTKFQLARWYHYWSIIKHLLAFPLRAMEVLCGRVVRVPAYRFRGLGSIPGAPDFLRSSGSETGSNPPREYNWGATWKKSSGSGLENREYGRRDSSRWPRGSLYPQKLALTSPTSGCRSVDIFRSRTQATEFSFSLGRAHLRRRKWNS
jgi:hypothetical protein